MQNIDLSTYSIGTVIRDNRGRVWEAQGEDTWQTTGTDFAVRGWEPSIIRPVTVLHNPDREQYVAVEFSTSNAAFANDDGGLDRMEAASILMQAADNIVARSDDGTLLDANGNTVGTYRVVDVTE